MEAFLLEFKEMKDSIKKLKDNQEEMTARYTQEIIGLKEDISQVKKENEILRDRVENLQNKEKEVESEGMRHSDEAASDDRLTRMNEKVESICLELNEVKSTVQEEKEKVDQFKTEISNMKGVNPPGAQQNEESNTSEGKKLLPLLASIPPAIKDEQHPSKRAISSRQARQMQQIRQENITRSKFEVSVTEITMEKDMRVWICDYTDVLQTCDFMDPVSGVYTVPVQGKYRFTVDRDDVTAGGFKYFLCTDKDEKEERIYYNLHMKFPTKSLSWTCDLNDKVWVEAIGTQSDNTVKGLKFSGSML